MRSGWGVNKNGVRRVSLDCDFCVTTLEIRTSREVAQSAAPGVADDRK